jgi:hypothetical protein
VLLQEDVQSEEIVEEVRVKVDVRRDKVRVGRAVVGGMKVRAAHHLHKFKPLSPENRTTANSL